MCSGSPQCYIRSQRMVARESKVCPGTIWRVALSKRTTRVCQYTSKRVRGQFWAPPRSLVSTPIHQLVTDTCLQWRNGMLSLKTRTWYTLDTRRLIGQSVAKLVITAPCHSTQSNPTGGCGCICVLGVRSLCIRIGHL